MIIVEKNEGTKIDYEAKKEKITFDDDLTINLKKRQEDWDVHIDVCYDSDGELVLGAAAGRSYVAEIDIPARTYTEKESEESTETEVSTDSDSSSGLSRNSTILEPDPLDMDKVTLTLWSID